MARALVQLLLRQQQQVEKLGLAFFIDIAQPGAPGVISRA
jgi:hypothetical protein